MSRQEGKRSGHGGRTLRSAGWQAVKFTARAADKAAVSLARWITTDHAGVGKALINMPSMGFLGSLRYFVICLFIGVAHAVIVGGLAYLLIAYGIPFLLGVLF